jgi:peroxiredoxin
MKTKILTVFMALFLATSPVFAAVEIGSPAPTFSGADSNGNTINLSDYLGKIVVLEWTNHECPYVKKHYESNNMQSLQKDMADKGVIWLTIVSSAEGLQGHTTPEEANKIMNDINSAPAARVLDSSGTIGKLYDARTTPHMFVIDQQGVLSYKGAIDDNPSARASDALKANNFVKEAVNALLAGDEIKVPVTNPYGCSVKYSIM